MSKTLPSRDIFYDSASLSSRKAVKQVQGDRHRVNKVYQTLKQVQGDRRVSQGDRRVSQGDRRVSQGDKGTVQGNRV